MAENRSKAHKRLCEIYVFYVSACFHHTIEDTTNNDSKAHKLLADLNIIMVLDKKIATGSKLSEKYLGSISSGVADELQKYTSQSRNI